jgi:tetratricopeptide (TPR) repeat protein
MKKATRIIIGVGCSVLLVTSWLITINSKSQAEKQLLLIAQATTMMEDGIYIRAMPLLEEAAGYDAAHTLTAENQLKRVYLALIDNRGLSRKYTGLLEKQMNRKETNPGFFIEAANYYLSISRIQEALTVLKDGINKTADNELIALYENSRYAYQADRAAYESVTAIYNAMLQVQLDGKWGIASINGTLPIPCEYDKISTFDRGRAIVKKDGIIYAVDRNNNRIALAQNGISDFGNLAEERIPLLIEGDWLRATGEFEIGTNRFEDFGMYSDGYAAAKVNGKWGVIDKATGWLIPAEYDEIIQDELGRCYAQGVAFARNGGSVYMLTKGNRMENVYEDARPFSDEGYAAVKKDGKWGYIDTSGNIMIDFIYDDALSFGQHLAAVKINGLWGFISLYGKTVIDPVFYEAKSFSGGYAPVLTERGWQIITLIEYKKGAAL